MNKIFEGFVFGFLLIILFFSGSAFASTTIYLGSESQVFLEENPLLEEINSSDLETPIDNIENNVFGNEENNNLGNEEKNESTTENLTNEGFSCEVISLTPKEAKGLMDLTHKGFAGKEIGNGKDENANGVDLEGLELVGKDNDGKTAVKQSPPTKASTTDRFDFFEGRLINGPFGVGVVLDDTVRVGRCSDLSQENCRVYGNGLNYRTSGKGVSNMFLNAGGTFSEFTKQKALGLSEQEFVAMQNQVYDKNDLKVKVVQLEKSDAIKNSFVTNQFVAKNSTTCNNNSCTVSTYSTFDKYFNSWFSTEMVVSTFGPTLINSAAKKLGLFRLGPSGGAKNKIVNFLDSKISKARSSFDEIPSVLLGKRRVDQYQTLIKEHGLGDFTKFTVGNKAFSSGGGGFVDELLEAGGKLEKLNPDQKKAFFKAVKHIKSYSEVSADSMKAATKYFDETGDLVGYGKKVANQIIDWDDATYLDFPAWIQKNDKLTGWAGLSVKKQGFPDGEGFIDLTTGDTHNFTNGILSPFAKDGDFSTSTMKKIGNNIQLYKLEPTELFETVPISDIDSLVGKLGGKSLSVNVPGRGMLPLNASTAEAIKNNPGVGTTIDVFKTVQTPFRELTPEDLAKVVTQNRIVGRPKTAMRNFNDLEKALMQKPEFVDRKALNALDASFAKEKSLLKDYYSFKANSASFYKVALGPTLLWQVKRWVGSEDFSAYMLPDTWTTLEITQGTDNIYGDAYIDFYGNEGSDQGDLFGKLINSFIFAPNYLAKEAVDKFSPQIGDKIRYVTGEGGLSGKTIMRDETKDLAFYSHNENCSGCTVNVNSKENYMDFRINAPVNVRGFIVEAVDQETANEEGTALIAYAHHSNIKGQTKDIEGDEINIAKASIEGTSCDAKLRKLNLGWAGNVSGALLAGGESLAYMVNPGFGLIASGVQQILITPQLQDCIDDKEGYYIHFYTPPAEEQEQAKSKEALSNETLTNAISVMSQQVDSITSGENPTKESLSQIKNDFQQFSEQAKQTDLLQATLDMLPPSQGGMLSKEIFYIWFKENQIPTSLKTTGQQTITDGNNVMTKDFENGDIIINGKKIVEDKKEIVGSSVQDNRIPADIIPKKVTTISSPNSNETVFEINTLGEVLVKEEQVLDCIRDAVKAQVGIEYSGTELTQVFGELKSINTENYGSVFVRDREIHLEGETRVKGTLKSKFIVDGYWQTRLEQDANKNVSGGKFIGMAFEHGSILLNEETGELVVWLRQHKESVLNSKEVSGMKAKVATITDPETECEQPAIELSAEGYPNDELGQKRVENFNTSMGHLGPFTQFVTDGKIYEFYAKRDESGECKDYFRVIDKETGEVLVDEEIISGLKQKDDGTIEFKTADGKTHTLEFDADNGVPKVSYNGAPSETLRSAQGPNGSFWFDPNTGQWYPENGIQIPLDQGFKDNGAYFDSSGKGTAANPMTFNIGDNSGSGFNIPSLPETFTGLTIFILLFLIISFMLTQTRNTKNKKKK